MATETKEQRQEIARQLAASKIALAEMMVRWNDLANTWDNLTVDQQCSIVLLAHSLAAEND